MPRILVAGGTGFLGRAITRSLATGGAEVSVLTRSVGRAARLEPPLPAEFVEGDVTRPETLPGAMAGLDTAVLSVQFAGYPVEAPRRGRTFMKVDAHGTAALVDAAVEAGVRKLVYVSGVGADPHSDRPWYRAKGLAEASVRESGLTWTVVRPSWVYGPDDQSLNRFIGLIRRVPLCFPQLGRGEARLTPLHRDDLARLVRHVALGDAGDGRLIEAGGPEVLTLDEIVRTAMRVSNREKPIVHMPIGLVKLAAALLELLPGQILSRGAVDFATQDGVADPRVARELLPELRPRDLETGLREYLPRA